MKARYALAVVGTLCALALGGGAAAGYAQGRKVEFQAWQQTLITWGCAGHERVTGEIVIFGPCTPVMLDAVEPTND